MSLFKKYWPYILLTLGAIPVSLPLLLPGFYEPHDLHHLADIHQMYRAFQTGQIPPRLGPDFTWGFGYPLFHFYYVFPFYLGALYYWLGGNLTLAFKMVFLTSIFVSLYGMYMFLRLYVNKLTSFAGAFLYLYTPYRAVQLYVRGAMGEALSIAILPLVAWSMVNLIRQTHIKNISIFSIVLSIYLLSHNYLWVLTVPFLGMLAILEIYKQKNKLKIFVNLIIGICASALITIYWWLPALLDQDLVAEKTPFLLVDHFPFIKQLILPTWGYGSSVWGPGDEISFQLGIINIVAILSLGVLVMLKRKKIKHFWLTWFIISGFAISVFFMNIRTYPIWRIIPFYDFIQFPWRLLFLNGFFSSLALALFLHNIKNKGLTAAIFVSLAFVLTFNYFKPSKIVSNSDAYYLERFFNDPNYSEDYLLLPKWVSVRPNAPVPQKVEIINGEIIKTIKHCDIHYEFDVIAENDAIFTYWAYYFPGWFVEIDGVDTEIIKGEPYGQITFSVPSGEHKVAVLWKETNFRNILLLISLLTTFTVFGSFIYFQLSKRQ